MSRKRPVCVQRTGRKIYSTEYKTRLVLEVLKNDRTLNEIASSNNITPKNLQNWKRTFLDNAKIAMEPARAVKEYKSQIKELEARNDKYAKVVGKLTVERDSGEVQNAKESISMNMI